MRIRSLFRLCALFVVARCLSAQEPVATGPVDGPIPPLSATGLQACAAAFVAPGDNAGANAFLEELVSVSACREDATLIDGDQIFGAIDPFNPPPIQKGKACQQ